jgi:hypothetical protein
MDKIYLVINQKEFNDYRKDIYIRNNTESNRVEYTPSGAWKQGAPIILVIGIIGQDIA